MTTTQEALKMAIEVLPELISQAQCEFDSQHKAYENYPNMYHRYGYLKDIADDGTKTLNACKEALEQQEQEPLGTVDDLVDECVIHQMKLDKNTKLYTHPAKQLSDDEKISIKRQINNAFNEGFEKGKNMSLVASIPLNLIKLESQADTHPAKQLIDDEIEALIPDTTAFKCEVSVEECIEFARAIEAKVRGE